MNTTPPTTPPTTSQHLSVEEASRLAVTATAADLEDWAHDVAVDGRVEVTDLVDVLDLLRAHSTPQQSAAPRHALAS
jgi:hypothetical protein